LFLQHTTDNYRPLNPQQLATLFVLLEIAFEIAEPAVSHSIPQCPSHGARPEVNSPGIPAGICRKSQ